MLFKTLLMIFLITTSLFSKEIGIYEKDVMAIDLDLKFTNEYNQTKTLREFMDGKPTILTINYFNCPTLCSPLLYEVASVVQRVGLEPGKDFNVITLSIEKNDTFKHAKDTKDKIPNALGFTTPSETTAVVDTTNLGLKWLYKTYDWQYENNHEIPHEMKDHRIIPRGQVD